MKRFMVVFLSISMIQSHEGWIKVNQLGVIKPKQTLSALQMLQALKTQPTESSTQAVYNFNFSEQEAVKQFCPFLIDFQTLPKIPELPQKTKYVTITWDHMVQKNINIFDKDRYLDDLNNYISNFKNLIKNLNTFISNYSQKVKSWQENNEWKSFSELLTITKQKQEDYNNTKQIHATCIANKSTSFTIQSGCNDELINHINATNKLYDSFEEVLKKLISYELAPTWATPKVVRVQSFATLNNQTFSYNGQPLAINNIKGFDSKSFSNQISIGVNYLQNQIKICNDAITPLNNAINNLNSRVSDINDQIRLAVADLRQTPGIDPFKIEHAASESLNLAQIVYPVTTGMLTARGIAALEMPAMTIIIPFLTHLGAETPAMKALNQLSAQANKGMVEHWKALGQSGSAAEGFENISIAIADTAGTLALGMISPIVALAGLTGGMLAGRVPSGTTLERAAETATESINPYRIAEGFSGL